jgi:hypothetical protein
MRQALLLGLAIASLGLWLAIRARSPAARSLVDHEAEQGLPLPRFRGLKPGLEARQACPIRRTWAW